MAKKKITKLPAHILKYITNQIHWSQRKDQSFSGIDMIRIWNRWLTKKEQDQVKDFFKWNTLEKLEILINETMQFFLDMSTLIHELFSLQWIQVYHRYKRLLKQRKRLLNKWLDFIGFPDNKKKPSNKKGGKK